MKSLKIPPPPCCGAAYLLAIWISQRQIGLLGRDVSNIFSALQSICDKLNVEPPQPLLSAQDGSGQADQSADGIDEPGEDDAEVYELSPPASPSAAQAPIDPYLSGAQPQKNTPVDGAGAGSPQRSRRRSSEREDLVSKGIITQERADMLVGRYLLHLDRFLYGIAGHYRDANEVRRASPTLLAAMCAVSAFQDVEHREVFELCYKEYRSLVSASLFEKKGLEYIRALCIGSFWLLDASRILLSDAIRRAADARLHRYFHRLTEDSPATNSISQTYSAGLGDGGVLRDPRDDARDKVRLWYLLFISDRHLSILHNRDSLIRQEKDAIEHRDSFLAADRSGSPASNLDIRLISQVSLLVIMGQIRDVLGSERARPTPKTSVVQFAHFAHELDQWFGRWSPRFEPDEHIGAFPLAGLSMHYHYARLYLGHHALQGLVASEPIPPHFVPAAAAARDAALAIFAMILDSAAFRAHIVGMPHYFHIMISFAGHFLLEVAARHREQLGIDAAEDLGRVAAALALFARTPAMSHHPIARALAGLTRRLSECTAGLGMESVLAGSPFQNAEYTSLMTDFSGAGDVRVGGGAADAMLTSLDVQAISGLSDDFLYGDFGDFHLAFPESQAQFSA